MKTTNIFRLRSFRLRSRTVSVLFSLGLLLSIIALSLPSCGLETFDIYPDQVDFMQWLPTGPDTCLIREISYVLDDDRREMRAARYLNWRINRQVNAEDTELIARVQYGMASKSFTMGPLSDQEVCLKSFCRRVRELIPEASLEHRPAPGWSQK